MKKKKKTGTIDIDNIKSSDGWYSLGLDIGLKEEEIYKVFEYGEYANISIIVDEDLNIIGGKIHPHKK